MLCILLPTTVYCITNAKKRAAQYPVDKFRKLSKADELTARAVQEAFPLLPDVWKVDGVEKNDANRDLVVHCVAKQSTRSFQAKSAAAPLLMRAIPVAWVLDTNPKSGILFQKDLSRLWGTSKPQPKIRTFMSHAWKADPSQTAAALNFSLKLRWMFAYLVFGIIFAWFLSSIHTLTSIVCFFVVVMSSYVFLFSGSGPVLHALLWLLGHGGASIWMDKATIKQTRHPDILNDLGVQEDVAVVSLNKLGAHLFPWFLENAEEIWICHSQHYFSRLWCAYEIATWLNLKGPHGIRFVSLECPPRSAKPCSRPASRLTLCHMPHLVANRPPTRWSRAMKMQISWFLLFVGLKLVHPNPNPYPNPNPNPSPNPNPNLSWP